MKKNSKKIISKIMNRLVIYLMFLIGIAIAIGPSHIDPVENKIAKLIFLVFGSFISFVSIGIYIISLINEINNIKKE